MFIRKSLFPFVAGASLIVAAAAQADASTPNACFANHRVGAITAYHRTSPQSRGYQESLAGARVFVYAEPGLTGEWLHYSLEQRRMAGSTCPIDVPGTELRVQSGGPGFWVTLSSDDEGAAQEILERAKRLAQR